MDSDLVNELVAVHLRYTAVARPLRTRAFAQLAAKALYTLPSGKTAKAGQIASDVAEMAGIPSISVNYVTDSLQLLQSIGLAEKAGHGWRLSVQGNSEIEADLTRTRTLVESILDRHFPHAIPRPQIKGWFQDTCTEYFGRYGTLWAASVCRVPAKTTTAPTSWKGIVPMIAKKHDIAQHIDALSTGFTNFIASSDTRDQEYMWSIGQAMFAARLIAAGVGADPITTREIRDSSVFLDTNILLTSSLEADKYAHSLNALSKALKTLNMKLMFLPITRNEYEQRVDVSKTQTLRVISRYPREVVIEASDPFTRTAQARGCSTLEDYERFFSEVGKIPSGLGDELIELCEDDGMILAADQGTTNAELLQQVADAWRSMRHYDKPKNTVMHDAALMAAVEDARTRGQRCWVLTTDRTMSLLSARRSGEYGIPSWVTLDALIQILAIDLAGPSMQAQDFGPLLSTVIKNETQPIPGTYTVQDLAWLLDIEERCADLGKEQIKACAAIVTRARLTGKRSNDPELQLDIQRAFQGNRLELVTEIGAAKADLAVTKRDLGIEMAQAQELRKALIGERTAKLRREAYIGFAWQAFMTVLWGTGCICAGIWLSLSSNSQDSTLRTIGLPSVLISAGVLTAPAVLWRLVSRLRKSLRSAREQAENQIVSISGTSFTQV